MKYNTFYNKYLQGIDPAESLKTPNSLKGQSPFGAGAIIVDEHGAFTCQATGKTGSVHDFIQALYPELSEKGVKMVVQMDSLLRMDNIHAPLQATEQFRKDKHLLQVAAEKVNLPESLLKSLPLYMDNRGFRYTMVEETSPNGAPLAISYFTPKHELAQIVGIRRFKSNMTQRVWLVENALMGAWVSKQFNGDTAIMWPKANELATHDFKALFAGRDVIVLHGEFTYTYAESPYPIYAEISKSAASVSMVNYATLTGGKPFAIWISDDKNQAELTQEAEFNKGKPSMDRASYESAFHGDATDELKFAQGTAKGHFFYGLNDGSMVQSHPVSILPIVALQKVYNVRVKQPERFMSSVRLDRGMVLSISESITTLTPRRTFNMIKGILLEHLYFEDDAVATLIALWIMGSYTFQLHEAYPYLHTQGLAGSGKSTLLEIVEETSFNGAMASRITNARLMHEINDTACTFCLDEFEKQTSSQKDSTVQILNSGYKKSGEYMRLLGNNHDSLDLYSPKIYASIDDINKESLKSRTLPIPMSRKPLDVSLRAWTSEDSRIKRLIKNIQQGGYAIGMYHHEALEYLMARQPRQINLPSGISIDARQRELIVPLIVMAELVDLDSAEGKCEVENELFKVLEGIFHPHMEEQLARIKMLANQLKEWGQNPATFNHVWKGETLAIDNKSWEGTALLGEFAGKTLQLLGWLQSINADIARDTTWLPSVKQSRSCTHIPGSLILNSKEVREWVSPETVAEPAESQS